MGNSEGEKKVASTSDGPKCRTGSEGSGGSDNDPGNDNSSSTNAMPSSTGSSTGDGSDRDEPPESSGEVEIPGTDQKTIGVTPWKGTREQCQKRIGDRLERQSSLPTSFSDH